MELGVEHGDAHQQRGGAQGAHHQVLQRTLQGALIGVAEGGEGHGGEGHDLHHDEDIEQVAGEHQTQHRAGEHEEQGVVVHQAVVMVHVGEGVDAGDKDGHGDDEAEEQAQGVHLQADAEGPALHRLPVAQPVGDDLSVQQHRLDQGQHHSQGGGHRHQHHAVAGQGAAPAHQGGDEGAHEEDHNGQDGEVVQKGIHQPFNLLILRVSRVPYCSLSLMTRLRLMAVMQAPMTMEVRVRA